MKRRARKIANFFAFNLLFFALYLNFIHKDKSAMPVDNTSPQVTTTTFTGTTLVNNPEQYLDQKNVPADNIAGQDPSVEKIAKEDPAALKLSIN
ncbi:MAG TPA: hypothetical protein VLJ68_12250 [Chitinophagaceae bacterium]|nr:hypothetical protein [Chitinophagaceae bacterium]